MISRPHFGSFLSCSCFFFHVFFHVFVNNLSSKQLIFDQVSMALELINIPFRNIVIFTYHLKIAPGPSKLEFAARGLQLDWIERIFKFFSNCSPKVIKQRRKCGCIVSFHDKCHCICRKIHFRNS